MFRPLFFILVQPEWNIAGLSLMGARVPGKKSAGLVKLSHIQTPHGQPVRTAEKRINL